VRINEAGEKAGVKVSVNDMLIKACAMALIAHPDANASYTDKGVAQHKSAHVSVAVAIQGGLITPVVRDAQSEGPRADRGRDEGSCDAGAREEAEAAGIHGRHVLDLEPRHDGHQGQFASIINPPEGMILSVGAGEKRCGEGRQVVVKDDKRRDRDDGGWRDEAVTLTKHCFAITAWSMARWHA
jgi:pyruvate dehydrogenase E2 component (dihydrolipoamide acetyltransferase)